MISLPIGFLVTMVIFVVSMGISNLPLYFNLHSALLVGGGTASILYFSNSHSVLHNLWHQIKYLFQPDELLHLVQGDLKSLAQNKFVEKKSSDELIAYAQDLWIQGINPDLFIVLLSQKRKEIEQRSVDAIQCLKNLAKYPPALGMAGTVMGIVTLFQNLDTQKDKIGASLALALTATFFGLAIANAFIMPLSDRLQVKNISQKQYLQNVYQVLLLINQGEASYLIDEEVQQRATA